MAKKQEKTPQVLCINCAWGGNEIVNGLIDCSNKQETPNGFKKGTWPHLCKSYKNK